MENWIYCQFPKMFGIFYQVVVSNKIWNVVLVDKAHIPHCVLFKHYSVDFPWWFDRKTSIFSLLSKTWKLKKKSCQMTEIQNCTLWFDRKNCFCWTCQLVILDWDFISIWKPNPCKDPLEKKFYCISFRFSFCRTSPFHREWLVLINRSIFQIFW